MCKISNINVQLDRKCVIFISFNEIFILMIILLEYSTYFTQEIVDSFLKHYVLLRLYQIVILVQLHY
jgi:hypothetical protein